MVKVLGAAVLAAASLSAVEVAHANEAESVDLKQLVVMDLVATDVSTALAANLSEIMVQAVRDAAPDLAVTAQSEVVTMLTLEQDKATLGCNDATCLAEIGGALGADHMIAGKIGQIGSVYLMSLKLINTRAATVERHRSKRITGNVEQLIQTVVDLATYLVRGTAATPALAATPQPASQAAPAADRSLPATAVAAAPPPADDGGGAFYSQWWFWTIIGGFVAGGGVATAVIVTQGGGGGSGGNGGADAAGTVQFSFVP